MSQDMYFCGYPFGLRIDNIRGSNGYPVPFVKRCILLGFTNGDTEHILYLDGYNNVGFSGGPITYKRDQNEYICGVISVIRIRL